MAAITAECMLSNRVACVELGVMGVELGVTDQGSFVESFRTPHGFQRLPTGPHAESGAPVLCVLNVRLIMDGSSRL